jgi:hypothetical protein
VLVVKKHLTKPFYISFIWSRNLDKKIHILNYLKHLWGEFMQCNKLFLSGIVLFVLLSFPIINAAGASLELWSQTYGGTRSDSAEAMVQTSDGGFALAGYTKSFGAGSYDFWLVKTDEYGNMEWNQTYGGTWIDIAYALVETSDGGYAIAGSTESFGAGRRDFWLVKTDGDGNV